MSRVPCPRSLCLSFFFLFLTWTYSRSKPTGAWPGHRRDCHFADALFPSLLLTHLLKVEGGAAERQSRRRPSWPGSSRSGAKGGWSVWYLRWGQTVVGVWGGARWRVLIRPLWGKFVCSANCHMDRATGVCAHIFVCVCLCVCVCVCVGVCVRLVCHCVCACPCARVCGCWGENHGPSVRHVGSSVHGRKSDIPSNEQISSSVPDSYGYA